MLIVLQDREGVRQVAVHVRLAFIHCRRVQTQSWMVAIHRFTVDYCRYLFNPFTVLSCVAMSTTSITHLLVTAALFFAISSRPILTGFAFAASIYFDVGVSSNWPIGFIVNAA